MKDTGRPGGFYKDQIYLIGAINILKNRDLIDWIVLYSGKLSLKDVLREDIQQLVNREQV